jgi:LPXTG-site transpeptidase (sortase) family protein
MPQPLYKIKNKRKTKKQGKILKNDLNRIRLFLLIGGFFFIMVGIFLPFLSKNFKPTIKTTPQGEVVISFSQEPINIDKSFLDNPNPVLNLKNKKDEIVKSPPTRVMLPSLGIDLPVKEASVVKGYWEIFPDVAGWGKGSAYPEENGNTVIFAHARDGLFAPLKKAKIGMTIYMMTRDKWYSYSINEIREVLPSQTEVIAKTDYSVLTLYTCTGFSDSKRLIVIAKKNIL